MLLGGTKFGSTQFKNQSDAVTVTWVHWDTVPSYVLVLCQNFSRVLRSSVCAQLPVATQVNLLRPQHHYQEGCVKDCGILPVLPDAVLTEG